MRTTLNIDDPVLNELKKLQEKEGGSLGRLVSDLLAVALRTAKCPPAGAGPPPWISKPMRARMNLADKEAVYGVLDARGEDRVGPHT